MLRYKSFNFFQEKACIWMAVQNFWSICSWLKGKSDLSEPFQGSNWVTRRLPLTHTLVNTDCENKTQMRLFYCKTSLRTNTALDVSWIIFHFNCAFMQDSFLIKIPILILLSIENLDLDFSWNNKEVKWLISLNTQKGSLKS